MKKIYKIKVENKVYEVELEEVTTVEGSVQGSAQAPVKTTPVATSNVTSESVSVNAPMPGTIVDIKVAVGESVTKGQVVAVLEAMKMETEIMSSVDGKVTSVVATKSATVNLDDVILTIN